MIDEKFLSIETNTFELEKALAEEESASKRIQKALDLDKDVVDTNQILRLYQWIRIHIAKIITATGAIFIALISYFFYSQDFKDDTKEEIQKINEKINFVTKNIEELQKEAQYIKVNQAEVNNMKYRIESLKEITKLKFQIEEIKQNKSN